jgi:DNA-directed RNA polymerase subunit F
MDTLRGEWTSTKWYSYWIFRLLSTLAPFHSNLSSYYFNFFSIQLSRVSKQPPKTIRTAHLVATIMNKTVSDTYLKYYKNTEAIEYISQLANLLKAVLKQRLETILSGKNFKSINEANSQMSVVKIFNLAPMYSYYIMLFGMPDNGFEPDKLNQIINFMNKYNIDPYQ